MAEKAHSDNSENLQIHAFDDISVSDVIETVESDISISAVGPDGVEHENVYPEATPSDLIAISTAADLGVPSTPTYQERFTKQLNDIRTDPYVNEVEIELKGPEFKWPPSFGSLKVKVKKGLKVTKSYKKEGDSQRQS